MYTTAHNWHGGSFRTHSDAPAGTALAAPRAKTTIDWVHRILKDERDIVISSRPLEVTAFQVENIRMAYIFYESGLSFPHVSPPAWSNDVFTAGGSRDTRAAIASRLTAGSQDAPHARRGLPLPGGSFSRAGLASRATKAPDVTLIRERE
jgi:hypothetical protein